MQSRYDAASPYNPLAQAFNFCPFSKVSKMVLCYILFLYVVGWLYIVFLLLSYLVYSLWYYLLFRSIFVFAQGYFSYIRYRKHRAVLSLNGLQTCMQHTHIQLLVFIILGCQPFFNGPNFFDFFLISRFSMYGINFVSISIMLEIHPLVYNNLNLYPSVQSKINLFIVLSFLRIQRTCCCMLLVFTVPVQDFPLAYIHSVHCTSSRRGRSSSAWGKSPLDRN